MNNQLCRSRIQSRAFKVALDSRKFEIELYWKRTKYFFSLLSVLGGTTVLLAVLGLVDKVKHEILFPLLITIECVGLVVSVAWLFVNKGSKYWQVNWEKYVDELGKDFIGPLFKYPVDENKNQRYSVSNINKIVSCFLTIIWSIVLFATFILSVQYVYPSFFLPCGCCFPFIYVLSVLLLSLYAIYRICHCKGGQSDTDNTDRQISRYLNEVEEINNMSPETKGSEKDDKE